MRIKAIHTIHRALVPGVAADKVHGTKAIPPKTEVIQPGQFLEAEGDELKFFFKTGAAAKIGAESPFLAPVPKKVVREAESAPEPDSSLSEEKSGSSQGDSDDFFDPATNESDDDDLVG